MVNGLKVIVRQGDLVDAEVDVIVKPANSELCHGGGARKTYFGGCWEGIR